MKHYLNLQSTVSNLLSPPAIATLAVDMSTILSEHYASYC